jgi:hypothetical protein
LKIDLNGYKQLNQIILIDVWSDKALHGLCILGWICYLEHLVAIPSTSHIRNNLVNDLPGMKNKWVEQFGLHPIVFQFASKFVLHFREANNSTESSISLESSSQNKDLQGDISALVIEVTE